jgi:gliding motility-associated-like protein
VPIAFNDMKVKVINIFLIFLVLLDANNILHSQGSVKVCAGQKGIKYQATGDPGSIFHWVVDGGQIISGTLENTITVNWGLVPGNYAITVYEEKTTGCLGNTKELKVVLQQSPIFDLGKIENICEGQQIELTANPDYDASQNRYLWQDGSTQTSLFANKSGIYWAEATSLNGCTFRDSVVLVVNPLPIINLGKDTILCAPNELVLNAGNSGELYDWSNGGNSQTMIAQENDGKIWVKVTDRNGCSGSDTIQILNCVGHTDLIIPKAFTPNSGTGGNLWIIGGVESYPEISVKIYDRWGIQVFESDKGYSKPWDGRSNGKDIPMDAYYYIINTGDGSKDIIGSVTIIR